VALCGLGKGIDEMSLWVFPETSWKAEVRNKKNCLKKLGEFVTAG